MHSPEHALVSSAPEEGGDNQRDGRTPRWGGIADWSLPIALWLLGTALLTFHLGRWTDDYDLAEIDPATGAIVRLTWLAEFPFWRPLHLIGTVILESVSFHQPWIGHLAVNLAHAGCAALVFALARMLGLGKRSSAAPGVLFLVCPLHAQAIHWIAAFGTLIATACALGACIFGARIVREGWTVLRTVAFFVLSWSVACWNEQPTGVFLALPILLAWDGRLARWGRVAGITAIAWLGAAAYVVIYLAQAPAMLRGSLDRDTTPGELFEGVPRLVAELWRLLDWSHELSGAWAMARATASAQGAWLGVLFIAGVALVIASAGVWAMRFARWDSGAAMPARGSRVAMVVFGLVAFVACWGPILLADEWTLELRYVYAPAAFLAIAIVAAVGGLLAWIERGLSVRAAIVGRAVVALGVASVGLVGAALQFGYAGAFYARWVQDQAEVGALVQAAPNPRAGAVFIPMRIETEGFATGAPRFDHAFVSAWGANWSAPNIVRQAYRRSDISAGWTWTPGGASPVLGAGAWGVRIPTAFRTELPQGEGGGHVVAHERAILFSIDRDGRVRVWPALAVVGPDGTRRVFSTDAHGPGARVEARAFAVPSGEWWSTATLRVWQWGNGEPGMLNRRMDDGIPLDALWLHPAYDGFTERDAAIVELPGEGARTLILRASLAEPRRSGDGVRVRVESLDGDGAIGAPIRLDPLKLVDGWVVHRVPISPGVTRARVRVDPGEAGDVRYDGVWVHALVVERP